MYIEIPEQEFSEKSRCTHLQTGERYKRVWEGFERIVL
tara:strand:+ start:4800 stop:4913 length:114 start_codon:yes stop_codon:yes gene_type:complete